VTSALRFGGRVEEEPSDLAGVMPYPATRGLAMGGLAAGGIGLAAPGVAVLALAAESRVSVGDSATWALTTPLLGESDDESEIVHSEPPFPRHPDCPDWR